MEISLKRLAQDFSTMLFPSACCLCGGPKAPVEQFICSPCLIQLPRERNYQGVYNDTATRLRGMFPFEQAYSFLRFSKKGQVQKLIHKIKYGQQPQLAYQLGVWFASESLFPLQDQIEAIIPIPIHTKKLKSRGYNQSLQIASGIASVLHRPIRDVLQRKHEKVTQTRLGRWQRFENTSNEFSLPDTEVMDGRSVLMVDDIITTGATMAGSAGPLLDNGVAEIVVAAIGLTQRT